VLLLGPYAAQTLSSWLNPTSRSSLMSNIGKACERNNPVKPVDLPVQ
jgi:hypothetical protein